jgi:hypothetical protein
VGTSKEQSNKPTLNRIMEVQKLPEERKNFILNLIDMAFRDFKTKQTYAS